MVALLRCLKHFLISFRIIDSRLIHYETRIKLTMMQRLLQMT